MKPDLTAVQKIIGLIGDKKIIVEAGNSTTTTHPFSVILTAKASNELYWTVHFTAEDATTRDRDKMALEEYLTQVAKKDVKLGGTSGEIDISEYLGGILGGIAGTLDELANLSEDARKQVDPCIMAEAPSISAIRRLDLKNNLGDESKGMARGGNGNRSRQKRASVPEQETGND